MARKRKHEEHTNHEAWAIPYGDLITLLLAFFVVMYAISSINEGKFRVLSDSLQAAFRGTPRTLEPVQVGQKTRGSGADIAMTIVEQSMIDGQPRKMLEAIHVNDDNNAGAGAAPYPGAGRTGHAQPTFRDSPMAQQLARVADELEAALKSLVDANLVTVRRHEFWLEVEVKTDILFASGEAVLSDKAIPALDALAETLLKYPNPVRVEGHTDNRPINTRYYPSNWELSAARAASVVHRFARAGLAPSRLSVIGFGEYRPAKPNDTVAGRDANRRVVIVILAGEGAPVPSDAADIASEASSAGSTAALPPVAADVTPITAAPPADGTEPAPLPASVGASAGIPARE
ncbi:MAG TPA: flagellar motor protein MotD [Steroidobacteraceae bacterium]|nr:flagellar motor protein MotD [Steroidobacteraceae bacterium]